MLDRTLTKALASLPVEREFSDSKVMGFVRDRLRIVGPDEIAQHQEGKIPGVTDQEISHKLNAAKISRRLFDALVKVREASSRSREVTSDGEAKPPRGKRKSAA